MIDNSMLEDIKNELQVAADRGELSEEQLKDLKSFIDDIRRRLFRT